MGTIPLVLGVKIVFERSCSLVEFLSNRLEGDTEF